MNAAAQISKNCMRQSVHTSPPIVRYLNACLVDRAIGYRIAVLDVDLSSRKSSIHRAMTSFTSMRNDIIRQPT